MGYLLKLCVVTWTRIQIGPHLRLLWRAWYPQQNGVVERKHRHLLEVARALRFKAGLPFQFWGVCVLTAAYQINGLPSPVIRNRTPYEVLLGKQPKYDHIRVFGSLV